MLERRSDRFAGTEGGERAGGMKLWDLKQYLASVAHINCLKDTCGLEPSGFARH